MRPMSELQLITILTAIAIGGGLLTGQMGWCFFLAAAAWGIRQYGEFEQLRQWAKRPLKLPPNVSDSWYELAITPIASSVENANAPRRRWPESEKSSVSPK